MGRLVGYARVSKDEQNLDLQLDALKQAGCEKKNIFMDKTSELKSDRPGLAACFERLTKGDTLVIWRLDRLGRNRSHMFELVDEMKQKEVGFKSLSEGIIDTTSATGEFVFGMFTMFAQYERRTIQERTMAGLAAARARGRLGGRRPVLADNPRVVMAKKLHADKSIAIGDIVKALKVSRSTLFRWLDLVPTKKDENAAAPAK